MPAVALAKAGEGKSKPRRGKNANPVQEEEAPPQGRAPTRTVDAAASTRLSGPQRILQPLTNPYKLSPFPEDELAEGSRVLVPLAEAGE